jgi:hypothetical protein
MGDQPADPTLKSVTIKGGAVQDYHKSKGLRKTAKRRYNKKSREEDDIIPMEMKGGNVPQPTPLTHTITKVNETLSGSNPPNATLLQTPAVNTALKVGTVPPVGVVNAPQSSPTNPVVPAAQKAGGNCSKSTTSPPTSVGGGNCSKSTTNSPTSIGGKIVLEPKKKAKSSVVLAPPTKHKHKRDKTRKIKVQLSNMKKRITTAKVIHKDSKEKSIEEIRKLLETAKLVKPAKDGKKVPEDILRNIYKDYLILRNKAL